MEWFCTLDDGHFNPLPHTLTGAPQNCMSPAVPRVKESPANPLWDRTAPIRAHKWCWLMRACISPAVGGWWEGEAEREQEDYRNVKIEGGKERHQAGELDGEMDEKRHKGKENNLEEERKDRGRGITERQREWEEQAAVTVGQRGSISQKSSY